MKNLKNQGRRFVFKILPHIVVIIVVIIVAVFGIKQAFRQAEEKELQYQKYKLEQDSLLSDYQVKMDSVESVNFLLEQELLCINNKIDSISIEQTKINEKHEKEIIIIRDATLSEHQLWFYAKLDSIRHYYGEE